MKIFFITNILLCSVGLLATLYLSAQSWLFPKSSEQSTTRKTLRYQLPKNILEARFIMKSFQSIDKSQDCAWEYTTILVTIKTFGEKDWKNINKAEIKRSEEAISVQLNGPRFWVLVRQDCDNTSECQENYKQLSSMTRCSTHRPPPINRSTK